MGMFGLAAAMGIGRFAFTPMLPLMQERSVVTLVQGGWLAAANYAGYLVGALLCVVTNPRPGGAARAGLVGVAISTSAMAVDVGYSFWLLWRFVAGIASALVLVGVSAGTLGSLARAGRPQWAGWVFAGVGVGIVMAGGVGLVVGVSHTDPRWAWLGLGSMALVVAVLSWRHFAEPVTTMCEAAGTDRVRFESDAWRLVLCYGTFGFGYIIPATFLPALARQLVNDPAVFGWVWPVFGATAAASTVVASLGLRRVAPRRQWAGCQFVMAVGVVLPALDASLPALLVAATCVGGTFMVLTMAGMQEARRVAGPAAARLIAAMTAAFALGQMLGPIVVTMLSSSAAVRTSSFIAAALLCVGGAVLLHAPRTPASVTAT